MSRRKKILLLGKNGMLGQAIQQNYELRITNYEFVSLNRRDLDIADKKQVSKKISELKPDVVINATGYTDVDGAESDNQTSFKVNADGVGYIAEACSQIGAHLIHFSTDYVFDGIEKSGYVENDVEHLKPVNVYGESKLEGEKNVKCPKFFIIRTSWLYGSGGRNFVDTMLKKARKGQNSFKVVDDQFGLPTWTHDLAERVMWIVDRTDQLESGIYHITNSKIKIQKSHPAGGHPKGEKPPARFDSRSESGRQLKTKSFMKPAGITWYAFAMEIFRLATKVGILSDLPKVEPCTTDEFPRPARRPKYSALINTKLPEMREWRKALRDYLMSNIK